MNERDRLTRDFSVGGILRETLDVYSAGGIRRDLIEGGRRGFKLLGELGQREHQAWTYILK
jgi:hypothetical protein